FNGLNKFDYGKGKFVQFLNNTEDSTTISDNSIWNLFESSKGVLWIGTANGLNRYDKENHTFERFYYDQQNDSSLSNNYVLDIYEDKEGVIWVATTEGLNKMLVGENGKVKFNRYFHQPGEPTSLSN